MHFLEWVKQSGNKILITDRVKKSNAVIRSCNRKDGQDICQLKNMTIQQIAEEVLLAGMALQGKVKPVKILKPEACIYLLNNILYKEQYEFIPKECYAVRTTEAVYQSMQQVRMNHRTELFEQEQSPKAVQLKHMIASYEAALKAEDSYDIARLLTEAIKILKGCTEEKDLIFLLPWLKQCSLAQFVDVEFTAIEQDFFAQIQRLMQTQLVKLEYCPKDSKVKYQFFKGYGIVNEVQYVVKQILEQKLPFGEVNVFYSQKEYEHLIKGLFEKHGIQYRFLSGENMQENHMLRFVRGVLQFAEEDFLYARLADVVENPWMTFYNVAKKAGVDKYATPINSYNYFLKKGIGWGLERYTACIEREENREENDGKYRFFLEFLKDVTEVFRDGTDCGKLYAGLLKLVVKYISMNEERKYILAALKELAEVWEQVEKQDSLQASIHMIKEKLDSMEASQDAQENAVSILRMQNNEYLERSHNFFIGLSAKQFMADGKESPVLSDKELQKYVEGKVELAKDAGARMRENVLGTLRTLAIGTVYMGCSTYDTVDMREYAPSVLYLDCLEHWGKTEEVAYQGFEIEKKAIRIAKWQPTTDMTEAVAEEEEVIYESAEMLEEQDESQEMVAEEVDNVLEAEGVDEQQSEEELLANQVNISGWEMSASGLHTLLECPLRYYYRYIKYLPERDFLQKSESRWLNAAKKGNLFHRTLQTYCEGVLMVSDKVEETFNLDMFKTIFEQQVVGMLEEQPYISEDAFAREKNEVWECCLNYAKSLQKELQEAASTEKTWKVLGCEVPFEKYPYVIQNPENEQEKFTVLFRGSIDRLDGYVDKQSVLHLRIIDYKTGDMSKFARELKNHRKLQHCIYAGAALGLTLNKKQEFESLLSQTYEKVEIECVQYVFPFEEKKILDATATDKKYNLPEAVGAVIVSIFGPFMSGDEELAHKNMKHWIDEMLKDNKKTDMCKYCTYGRQCRRKIGSQ